MRGNLEAQAFIAAAHASNTHARINELMYHHGQQDQAFAITPVNFSQQIKKELRRQETKSLSLERGIHTEYATEGSPLDLGEFFHGISEDPLVRGRLEILADTHFTLPTYSQTPPTEIVITKPRQIVTEDDRLLFSRLAIVKGEGGLCYYELYGTTESLEDIQRDVEHLTFINPALVEISIRGASALYENAHDPTNLVIRIIDPTHESIFSYGSGEIKAASTGNELIQGALQLDNIFANPDLDATIPQARELDEYIHYDEKFDPMTRPDGSAYVFNTAEGSYTISKEHHYEEVDLGDEIPRDLFAYRIKFTDNEGKTKVTRLITNRSLQEALTQGETIEDAWVRLDTKCACHINTDGACGCRKEFRDSFLEAAKSEPSKFIMIALDTNGVGFNNGLLALFEQDIRRNGLDTETTAYENVGIMHLEDIDKRDFTHQANILLFIGQELGVQQYHNIASNGKKLGILNQRAKALQIDAAISNDTIYHQRVSDKTSHRTQYEYKSTTDASISQPRRSENVQLSVMSYPGIRVIRQDNRATGEKCVMIEAASFTHLEQFLVRFPWIRDSRWQETLTKLEVTINPALEE